MTFNRPTLRLTSILALLAIGLTAASWLVWDAERGVATAVGGGLSVLNWISLRWLVARVIGSHAAVQAGMSVLLVAKMGALMAILSLLLQRFALDPLGLVLGLSVLFVGPVLGALVLGNETPVLDTATAGTAGEEL